VVCTHRFCDHCPALSSAEFDGLDTKINAALDALEHRRRVRALAEAEIRALVESSLSPIPSKKSAHV
jgi:hypothetical protein